MRMVGGMEYVPVAMKEIRAQMAVGKSERRRRMRMLGPGWITEISVRVGIDGVEGWLTGNGKSRIFEKKLDAAQSVWMLILAASRPLSKRSMMSVSRMGVLGKELAVRQWRFLLLWQRRT